MLPALMTALRAAGAGRAAGAATKAVLAGGGTGHPGADGAEKEADKGVAGVYGKVKAGFRKLSAIGWEIQGVGQTAASIGHLGAMAAKATNPLATVALGVGAATKAFTVGMDAAVGPLKSIVGSFGTMRDSVASLGGATSEFVKMSNPMAVKLFELALNDATAAIGMAIQPVHDLGVALMRAFGDIALKLSGPVAKAFEKLLGPLTSVLPRLVDSSAPVLASVERMIDLFGAAGAEIGATVAAFASSPEVLAAVQMAVEAVEVALPPLVEQFTLVVQVTVEATGAMIRFYNSLMALVGIRPKGAPGGEKIAGRSAGLAVTSASVGGLDSYINKAFSNAFSLGSAGAKPEAKMAASLDEIHAEMQKMPKNISDLMAAIIAGLPAAIAKAMLGGAPGAPDGVSGWDLAAGLAGPAALLDRGGGGDKIGGVDLLAPARDVAARFAEAKDAKALATPGGSDALENIGAAVEKAKEAGRWLEAEKRKLGGWAGR